jgi:hydrogenase/urease accessory protein HupE
MGAITPTEARASTTRRGQRFRLASSAVMMMLGSTIALLAHDPGLSALDVKIDAREIVAVLSVAAADAAIAGGPKAMPGVSRDSILLSLDGHALAASTTSFWSDDSGGIHVRLVYERPPGSRLSIRSTIPVRLARGHRELLSARREDSALLVERMLDAQSGDVIIDMSAASPAVGSLIGRFFSLGIRHILTGYDHLLFLAGVLVVLRRWRDVIRTITAFTVAHSLTLLLAATGLLVVPGRIVEPLIAASIVYVGVENLVRPTQGCRWKLTFGFGLVHGLGFATALRDLGVTAGGAVALPVASFNAGVEAGQIAVAALLVPIFWRLSRWPIPQTRFATIWSVLVAVAGSYWLFERIA